MRPLAVASLLAVVALASSPAHAVKVGPVEDPIGVLKIAKGQPIVIGGYYVLSGPDTSRGLDSKRGAEVYFKEIKNTILGHPIKFSVEDSGCNAEGGQTAATKIASNQSVAIVIGPACSSEATPAAPILWKAGITNIGTACTAPHLTSSERGPQYDGFVRTVYSDAEQAIGDAEWMCKVKGWKNAATVHDGSPYSQQLAAAFGREFEKRGCKIVAAEAAAPTDVDVRPMLTRISAAKPDVLYFPTFVALGGHITRQAKEIAGLTTNLIGGGAFFAADYITASGAAIVGQLMTFPDVSAEALGRDYKKMVESYKEMFGEAPTQAFHAHAYDAAKLAHRAIERVAVKDNDGNTYIGRKALRDAVFTDPGFDGMSGPIKCDPHGDCGAFKFAVYQWTNADPKTFDGGTNNPKKIYTMK
ncbi:MAG: branched-chain amino acid ABC transporter substrate-binding protein [Alphaproteobacteria bacterium]